MPLIEHLKLTLQQTGALPLAVTDLEQELASGERLSMRRDLNTGKAEPLPRAFWAEHVIDVTLFNAGSIAIYRRRESRSRWGMLDHDPRDRVAGHAYFVHSPPPPKPPPKPKPKPKPPPPPVRRKQRAGPGPRLLSDLQIKNAQAYYDDLLDQAPQRWRRQQDAAKHIAVTFLQLPEGSFQTVEDYIVVPVLKRRGLKKKRKQRQKK